MKVSKIDVFLDVTFFATEMFKRAKKDGFGAVIKKIIDRRDDRIMMALDHAYLMFIFTRDIERAYQIFKSHAEEWKNE